MRARLSILLIVAIVSPYARAGGFDFPAFRAVLESHPHQSIEELLPSLPVSLRNRYALVFSSRSLQGASFKDPRVILFGDDARFIVTFNGERTQAGFYTLETMEFNEDEATFQFREVRP